MYPEIGLGLEALEGGDQIVPEVKALERGRERGDGVCVDPGSGNWGTREMRRLSGSCATTIGWGCW